MTRKMLVRGLVGLSLLMNLVVIGLAAWLYWGGGARVAAHSFIGPAHARLVSQFEQLPVARGDIVLLGDSITAGARWSEWFPEVPTRNRGIGGDTSDGVLARLDPIVSGEPAAVFLMIGTNDLSFGVDRETVVANIDAILGRFERDSPDTRLFVQSVLPRAAEWADSVEALNAELEALAEARGATWIDLYPDFVDAADRSLRDELSNDELHLLSDGYALWRSRIEGHVQTAARQTGPTRLEPVDLTRVEALRAPAPGRWRLVNLWATWCTPCLKELPQLVEFDRRYRSEGLDVVTLSIDDLEQRDAAFEFLAGIDAAMQNWIIGLVDVRDLAEALDEEWRGPLPYTVLVAPSGDIVYRKQGTFDADILESIVLEQLGASG